MTLSKIIYISCVYIWALLHGSCQPYLATGTKWPMPDHHWQRSLGDIQSDIQAGIQSHLWKHVPQSCSLTLKGHEIVKNGHWMDTEWPLKKTHLKPNYPLGTNISEVLLRPSLLFIIISPFLSCQKMSVEFKRTFQKLSAGRPPRFQLTKELSLLAGP